MRSSCWRLLTAGSVEPKPERLDVALGLGDPVVAHHLLELILVARVDEPAAGVARRRPRLRLDPGVGARERARAVEVGQRLALVGRGERRRSSRPSGRSASRSPSDCTGFGKNTCAGAVLPVGVGLAASAAGAIAAHSGGRRDQRALRVLSCAQPSSQQSRATSSVTSLPGSTCAPGRGRTSQTFGSPGQDRVEEAAVVLRAHGQAEALELLLRGVGIGAHDVGHRQADLAHQPRDGDGEAGD